MGIFSAKYLWQTVAEDVPELKKFCKERFTNIST